MRVYMKHVMDVLKKKVEQTKIYKLVCHRRSCHKTRDAVVFRFYLFFGKI